MGIKAALWSEIFCEYEIRELVNRICNLGYPSRYSLNIIEQTLLADQYGESTMAKELYKLPALKYGYADLEPYISEEQLRIHHEKHHQAYVTNVNSLLQMMEKARREGTDFDYKATAKAVAFNLGGHVLHDYFWWEMTPAGNATKEPVGELAEVIKEDFGNFERFKKEFTQTAASVEGSGWAALTFCNDTKRLGIMQIEKHNVNLFPDFPIIMAIDVWEHAYYLDYKNERGKFIDAFWNIVNWEEIDRYFRKVQQLKE